MESYTQIWQPIPSISQVFQFTRSTGARSNSCGKTVEINSKCLAWADRELITLEVVGTVLHSQTDGTACETSPPGCSYLTVVQGCNLNFGCLGAGSRAKPDDPKDQPDCGWRDQKGG